MKIPEKISGIIESTRSVVLFTHVHPDGDALGSLFGFADILESMQKKVFCFIEEPVPYLYHFLPGRYRANTSLSDLFAFVEANEDVVAISLDCGDCKRLGGNVEDILKIQPFLVIDHHSSHKNFGQYRWVDQSKSSTGEMVYKLARRLEGQISWEAAYNLYVAIATDTGFFCYNSTSAETLRVAADLVDRGVRPDEIAGQIHNNYTPERIRLMEMVLGTLQLYNSGRLATIHVSQEMIAVSKALPEDIEGFVDFPRSIKKVKVAAFFKESGNDIISVSLRAKGDCDVAEIAKSFNGGGHRNAAGFRFSGKTLEQVREIVTNKLLHVV